MTQKNLEQIIPLRNEIRQLKREIGGASVIHDVVQGSDKDFPYLEHYEVVQGCDDDTLLAKERVKYLVDKHNKLVRFIHDVEDSQMRQILRLRYIKGYKWQKIAFAIDRTDEGTPRKRTESFLKNSENSEKPML